MKYIFTFVLFVAYSSIAIAHDSNTSTGRHIVAQTHQSKITYLGNEALLVEASNQKFLFDPFFSHNFGHYQLVPNDIKQKMLSGVPPYDGIAAILISHAHDDHFDAKTMVDYLKRFSDTVLYASEQAIAAIRQVAKAQNISLSNELVSVALSFGDAPWNKRSEEYAVNAVRIPHAGWPARAEVENLVFSVTLKSGHTIMHMGDADPDDTHYMPYRAHWRKNTIDVNFPPYWFLPSAEGRDILFNIIGAEKNIGIHVPVNVPNLLKHQREQYFSQPGESYVVD